MEVDALAVKAQGSSADKARKERRESGVGGMGESYLRIKGISEDSIKKTRRETPVRAAATIFHFWAAVAHCLSFS
jgi:hypothetical protein